jgi:two-component system, OmpR family, response regulator
MHRASCYKPDTLMCTILLVDDDEDFCSLLGGFFRTHGHAVRVAADGKGLFAALDTHSIDLVVLDVMLRGEDGFSLCRQLRAVSPVPVIMLTAMSDHTDRVVGLEVGADDYLTKPFDQRELLARIRAVLRRTTASAAAPARNEIRPLLYFDGWRLDVARRELRSAKDTLVPLSGSEFDLLLAFVEHPRRILTRDQLIDMARGPASSSNDRGIDVLVSRLRHKLEQEPKSPALIRTIRNSGYIFSSEVMRG